MNGGDFYAAAPRPSIWKRLGFGVAAVPPEPDPYPDGCVEGAIVTDAIVFLDWRDRLRLLVSGRLNVVSRIVTDARVVFAVTSTSTSVLAPGDGQAWRSAR